MHPYFVYMLQVNIALALFYMIYALVLKRDTFLRLKRFFFLSVIIFSLIYPLLTIPALSNAWSFPSSEMPEQQGTVSVSIGEPGFVLMDDGDNTVLSDISWGKALSLLYLGVSLLLVLRFASQLISIYRIRARSEKQIVSGIQVRRLDDNTTPFSFFKLIFVHANRHSQKELDQILLHEQTHVKQWHSIDIVLIELLYVFFWWNPFVWLMKREISMNLEYLADNEVLREGVDSREYQYHLLRLTYQETAVPIVNNFNVSQLKQRVMMMNKTKSPASQVVKYLVVLPFFFLLITANSVYGGNHGGQADASIAQDGQFLPEPPPLKVTDEVFGEVENLPEYPGGNSAMMKFLADNIRYPVIALENGIQGRIVCSFIITKDGSISNVNVLRGVDPSLDAEVVRIVNMMEAWKPGTQDGKKVNVQAVFPVVFRVQRDGFQEQVLSNEDRLALAKRELDDLSAMGGKFLLDELVIVGYAPGADKDPVEAQQTPKKATVGDEIFMVVEEQPYFPGGNAAMMEYMRTHIKYPVEAQQNGVQGRVICNFIVRKDGNLTDISVVRSVDPLLDAEAVRLIGEMPKWVPGKQRGQVVNVRFTLPIVFRLDKNEETE